MAKRREAKGFPRPDRERVIAPDHEGWKGLPTGLEYVKEATWKLGIAAEASTTFTGRYIYYIEPGQVDLLQRLYDRLDRSGDGKRL
jgi:hypothetical protein